MNDANGIFQEFIWRISWELLELVIGRLKKSYPFLIYKGKELMLKYNFSFGIFLPNHVKFHKNQRMSASANCLTYFHASYVGLFGQYKTFLEDCFHFDMFANIL